MNARLAIDVPVLIILATVFGTQPYTHADTKDSDVTSTSVLILLPSH